MPTRQLDMITLYSFPELFGVADNNPYGLKVFAFLKLSGLPFRHEHIFDSRAAPRGQLPYIVDGEHVVGDSDTIIAHLREHHPISIDRDLTDSQRTMTHLLNRTLENLYWVMSYSRWKDPEYWPLFRNEMVSTHPVVTESAMEAAQQYNFERYHYQGIGRYEPEQVYARGIADLRALASLIPASGFLFGDAPSSADASIYGFIANILFFRIDTPLKRFVDSHADMVRHCDAVHALVAG